MFSKTLVTGIVRPEPAVLHLAPNPACLLLRPLQSSSFLTDTWGAVGEPGKARAGSMRQAPRPEPFLPRPHTSPASHPRSREAADLRPHAHAQRGRCISHGRRRHPLPSVLFQESGGSSFPQERRTGSISEPLGSTICHRDGDTFPSPTPWAPVPISLTPQQTRTLQKPPRPRLRVIPRPSLPSPASPHPLVPGEARAVASGAPAVAPRRVPALPGDPGARLSPSGAGGTPLTATDADRLAEPGASGHWWDPR